MKTLALIGSGILGVGAVAAAAYFMSGPTTVDLGQIVIGVNHMEIIGPPAEARNAQMIDVKSSNPSVATAVAFRVAQIQLVGVAPGKTDVEFFDVKNRVLYKKLVWVEMNAPSNGGAGYDPTRTQLEQIVMLPRHTQNVAVPGEGRHQISSVTSSNPSAATARTEPPDAVQVYSVALGNTWVNFSDNATNIQYQVHVWVVDNINFVPPPLPVPGHEPIAGVDPVSNQRHPEPEGDLPKAGEMDPCLVGTWRVERLYDQNGWSGGAGAIVAFTHDGTQTIDYSSMAPLTKKDDSMTWTGRSVSRIAAARENAVLLSIESGDLVMTLGAPSNFASLPFGASMVGPAGLGGLASGNKYRCEGDGLEYETTWDRKKVLAYSLTLVRVGN